jgi:hypothetical protein
MDGLEVYRSSIHGYGIRALRPFRAGDVVIVGDGVLWRESETFDDEYALVLPGYIPGPDGSEGPPLYYDLADQTRWLNHSCEPNCEVDVKWDAEQQLAVPWWSALRDIEPGEELSYDYAFSGPLAVPCRCGARRCRGLIVDPDEIELVPDRYRHLLRDVSRAAG